jgi:hypothetical protein
MAIVVENGTVVAGANSYVTEAELTDYASERGITLSGTPSVLLIKAMDYLESLNFIGTKHIEEQPLQWPRDEVYVDTYYIERETIPKELKTGQMVTAIAIDQNLDPLRSVARATKRAKADTVEVEFMDNAASETIVRTINAALRKLIANGGAGGTSFAVRRA